MRKLGHRQNSSISSFITVFVGYSTQFLAPGMISMASDPGARQLGRRPNSSIWSFLVDFGGDSTQFLASGMNSTAHAAGYMKIGTSSNLVDLVISSHFCGL